MLLKLAILAVLDEAPRIGHRIRRMLDDIAGLSLTANQGQVYATLARLARAGMITRAAECDHARAAARDRSGQDRGRPSAGGSSEDGAGLAGSGAIYALLPRGRAQLRAWLAAPLGTARPRDELLARILFLLRDGDGPAVARLVAAQREAIDLLASRLGATGGDPVHDRHHQGKPPQTAAGAGAASQGAGTASARVASARVAARRHLEAELAWLDLVVATTERERVSSEGSVTRSEGATSVARPAR